MKKMYLGKEVRVLLKGKGKEAYLELKRSDTKEARIILKSFNRIKKILKDNPHFGDPIRKSLIPKKFLDMGVKNLYRVELSNYWRMLYTIEGNEIDILLFVLSLADHKDYDHLFGYKGR